MTNPFEEINKKIQAIDGKTVNVRCATVTSVSPFQCKLDGEETSNAYLKLKGYTPTVGDRVCFLVANKKYIMLGAYE